MKLGGSARVVLFAALAMGLAACSAVVDPDTTRLGGGAGGSDGGGGGSDGGGGGSDGGGTDGGGVDCAGGCDDGVPCTVDACDRGVCTHTANDTLCDEGERCSREAGCERVPCAGPADCTDGDPCTADVCTDAGTCANPPAEAGVACDDRRFCTDGDVCDGAGACVGTDRSCEDGLLCTIDSCDEEGDQCVRVEDESMCSDPHECTVDACDPGSARDATGCVYQPDDGRCGMTFCSVGGRCDPVEGCVGGSPRDCRDGNPCTVDSCSDAMMACVNTLRDGDMDGYPAMRVSGTTCAGGTDCDDFNAAIHPGATDVCNSRDDDCDGMTDEECVPATGDTCASAIPLTLSAGSATVTGTLGTYRNDYDTICDRSGDSGPDVVYYIDVTTASDVTIDTIGSTADTVVAVGLDCSNSGFGLGCDDDIQSGRITASRIWVHRVAPAPGSTTRRLYILVDGYYSGATGGYTLNVSVAPAASDTCTAPIDISGGGALVGFVSLAAAVGGQRGSCQSDGDAFDPEGIATLLGPADGNVALQAWTNQFVPDLYVRGSPCGSGTELFCEHGRSVGGGFNLADGSFSVTPSARYYVFVDGADAGDSYFVSYEP